jgi:hypothetical protein
MEPYFILIDRKEAIAWTRIPPEVFFPFLP